MQEAKPIATSNFQINNVMTEAFQLLPGSKWPIIGGCLALLSAMVFTLAAEYILYFILVKTGGNIKAGMLVMGSAIGLTGLYFSLGITGGIFKVVIERARHNPISLRMNFHYFSRGLPLLFTFLLYSIVILLTTVLSFSVTLFIILLCTKAVGFIRGYAQLIFFILTVMLFISCVQTVQAKISYRAPLIIFIMLVFLILFFLFPHYVGTLGGITLQILIFIFSTFVSAFLYLSLPLAVDKTNSPFKAIFLSLKTVYPHWFKVVLLLGTQYFIFLITSVVYLFGLLLNSDVISSLGIILIILSEIWVIPLTLLMLGVTYHKLID